MVYIIVLTALAQKDLADITDQRIKAQISKQALRLKENPIEQADSVLSGNLHGFYSVRAVKARYRIVYRVIMGDAVVSVEVIGIRAEGDRKDVYNINEKRLK